MQPVASTLQITVHALLLGHGVLGRSTGRLEPEMLLKFQLVLSPVLSAAGQSETEICERGFTRPLTVGGLSKPLGDLSLPIPLPLFTSERQV
jgi:hypothetical protein